VNVSAVSYSELGFANIISSSVFGIGNLN